MVMSFHLIEKDPQPVSRIIGIPTVLVPPIHYVISAGSCPRRTISLNPQCSFGNNIDKDIGDGVYVMVMLA